MGMAFALIADEVLEAEDPEYYTECQVCGTRGTPVYRCQGYLVSADGVVDRDEDRYVACDQCLKAGRIAHIDEYRTDPLIDRFARNPAQAKALLRSTPRIPSQMQGCDWPICCGDLAEFVGSPKTLEELVNAQTPGAYWELGESATSYDAARDGAPESYREVSFFRCQQCRRLYWVFQPS